MYATPTFKKDVALKPPTPSNKLLRREDGVAMLTVLMLTIILTVIGIAAITTTSLDMRMAGSERMRENSLSAAEACMSSGVQIIQQTLAVAQLPPTLTAAGANPAVTNAGDPSSPKVIQVANPLQTEIMGGSDQNADTADPSAAGKAPNAVLSIPSTANPLFRVYMDIDRLYIRSKAGGAMQFANASSGTGGAASLEILYRIDCYAVNVGGTSTAGRISGVYACVATGDSCQRQ